MTMARNEASGLWGDCGYDDEWPQRSRQCHTFAQSHRIRLTRWAPQRSHTLSVFRLRSWDALRGVRCGDAPAEDRPGQDHQGAGIRTPLVPMLDLLCRRTASGIHPADAILHRPYATSRACDEVGGYALSGIASRTCCLGTRDREAAPQARSGLMRLWGAQEPARPYRSCSAFASSVRRARCSPWPSRTLQIQTIP